MIQILSMFMGSILGSTIFYYFFCKKDDKKIEEINKRLSFIEVARVETCLDVTEFQEKTQKLIDSLQYQINNILKPDYSKQPVNKSKLKPKGKK